MKQGMSKEALLNKIEETAHNYERDYFGCARSALLSLQEHLDLGDDLTFQASTLLCSDALRDGTCAAMLAGLLAVGLVTAPKKMEKDRSTVLNPIITGFRLLYRFQEEFGTTRCSDIRKAKFGFAFNPFDPKQFEKAVKAGALVEIPKMVGKVSRVTAEFILELQEENKKAKS